MSSLFGEMLQILYMDDELYNIEYENELVDKFSKNPSLEEAKKLVIGNDEDAIYTVLEYWGDTNQNLSSFMKSYYNILSSQNIFLFKN